MVNCKYLGKSSFVLLIILFCCQLAGYGEESSLYLNRKAGNGYVYYVRIPALTSERKRQEQYLFRTAAQIAMRNEIFVQYITDKDSIISVLTEYNQTDSLGVSTHLSILSEKNCGEWFEALVEYDQKKQFVSYDLSLNQKPGKDGNPSWVSKPPKSKKYESWVSTVVSPPDPAEGFFLADEWAIGGLVTKVSTPVVSGDFSKYEYTLKGAYIASRWYNEKKNTYYSLAILPK